MILTFSSLSLRFYWKSIHVFVRCQPKIHHHTNKSLNGQYKIYWYEIYVCVSAPESVTHQEFEALIPPGESEAKKIIYSIDFPSLRFDCLVYILEDYWCWQKGMRMGKNPLDCKSNAVIWNSIEIYILSVLTLVTQ